ncbi:MAG: GNAT family N-acetyltransferase [candidate division WOR-3 bacterium]
MAGDIVAEVHPDPADYWMLGPEWKELLEQVGETSPFFMPLWIGLSYDYFGGQRLSFLISLRQRGKLVGIAPLSIGPVGNTVRFAVDGRLTDYADIILAPAIRAEGIVKIVETIKDFMGDEEFGVVLEPIRGNSPNLLVLEQVFGGKSRMISSHLAIKLPQNPDEFLYKVLRPEDRRSLLKREDRLTRSHEVEVECLREPMEVSENLDELLWMFVTESTEKKEFMTRERGTFLKEVMPLAAKEGSCRLYYIKVNGARVAGHLVLENRDTVFVYMSAEDAVGAELSAGILLLKSITENAIERGFSWLDFGRGGEEYKRRLGAKEGKVYRLVAGRPPVTEEDGGKPENLMKI